MRLFCLPGALLSLISLLTLIAGCADSYRNSTPIGADAAPHADADADAGVAGCASGAALDSVRGAVLGEGGKVFPHASAQLCLWLPDTRALCLQPVATDAAGGFAVQVPESLRCIERAALRVASSDAPVASLYCPIASPTASQLSLAPFVLGALPPATTLPAEGNPDTPRKVVFDDGLELIVTPSLLLADIGSYARLGGRRVALGGAPPCFLPPTVHLEGLYAFSVEGDIDGAFPVRIPNITLLPPGTIVDLYVLGGLGSTLRDGLLRDEGELRRFGQAHVSANGSFIEGGEAAAGLPCLTWLAYSVAH